MDGPSQLFRRAGPDDLTTIVVFDTIIAISFFILIVNVLVAWFGGMQRIKTWYLLQLAAAGYALSFAMLLGHQTGPEPPLQFCAMSAALIYAAPVGASSATLFFVIELHLRLSSALFSRTMSNKFIYWVAWGIPLSHGVVFWTALLVGLSDVSKIQRDPTGIYCHVADAKLPTLMTGTLVIIFLAAMLLMEVITIVHLVRQQAMVRQLRIRGSDFPLSLFIRMVVFTFFAGFAIVLVDVVMNATNATIIIMLSFIPLSIALVFGTQAELLQVFFCHGNRDKRLSDSTMV
ncbi:hypothetical protein HMN09_00944200 [Mycena chlorophos]|uniref:Uncharacterized protein n=1 Tax=Mycena chlorophos TaxID=658473 RepID=A0A8H6SKM7_MYCCL|nr:hypothetical protein HMN09_00944200 [Mycena chlorophos]